MKDTWPESCLFIRGELTVQCSQSVVKQPSVMIRNVVQSAIEILSDSIQKRTATEVGYDGVMPQGVGIEKGWAR